MSLRHLAPALAVLAACGPAEPAKNPRFDLKGKAAPTAEPAPKLTGPPSLPAQVIAELANESTEVHFARNGTKGLLLSRQGGRWLTGPVLVDQKEAVPDDHPALQDVAPAPAKRAPLSLVPRGEGFLLVWARPTPGGDEVWVQGLTHDGAAIGEAQRVGKPHPAVRWVDALVSERGKAHLIWEVRRGESDEVHAAPLLEGDKPGASRVVAEDVLGWHAVATSFGAAVAWVGGRGDQGQAKLAVLGPDARTVFATDLSPKATASPDVQLARSGDQVLAAWTDGRAVEPHVWLARFEETGVALGKPRPATKPVGRQALVTLVATEDHRRVLLAWEEAPPSAKGRRVELATLDGDGQLDRRAALGLDDSAAAPHIVPDGTSFAALTLAPLRQSGEPASPDGDPVGPVFVRFDDNLGVRSAEPIRVDALADAGVGMPGVPASVHGLSCAAGVCSVLASGPGSPTLLALVSLPVRQGPWFAPVSRIPSEPTPPEAIALSALGTVDAPLADMAAAKLRDGRTIVTWVTHFPGAGDGAAPAGATLAYRLVAADGTPGEVKVLSTRAISIGGVDVVAMPEGEKALAVLGWAGPSNKSSQVYLTSIDQAGDKLRQKTLTRVNRRQKREIPNEVYDIDLVARADGGVVATWADTRHGNPEIYVARANDQLARRDRERRITDNGTASTEPTLARVGDQLMLLWSDGTTEDSDLYLRPLAANSLVPKGSAVRLHDGKGRSRAPSWAGNDEASLAVSWIEESSNDASNLHMVALDARGRTITAVREVSLSGAEQITSATVRCTPERCRGVLSGVAGRVLQLGAFETKRELGGPVRARPVGRLEGATAQQLGLTAPALDLGLALFVRDRGAGSILRRLDLRW